MAAQSRLLQPCQASWMWSKCPMYSMYSFQIPGGFLMSWKVLHILQLLGTFVRSCSTPSEPWQSMCSTAKSFGTGLTSPCEVCCSHHCNNTAACFHLCQSWNRVKFGQGLCWCEIGIHTAAYLLCRHSWVLSSRKKLSSCDMKKLNHIQYSSIFNGIWSVPVSTCSICSSGNLPLVAKQTCVCVLIS